MKVLIVAPAPPNNFHRIRLTHIIKALKKDYKVDIVCQSTTKDSGFKQTYKANIFKKNIIKCFIDSILGLPKPVPLEASFCFDKKLQKHINKIQKNYDLIIIKRLRSAIFLPDYMKVPVIIDSTDAMSMYYKKALSNIPIWKKSLFLEEFIKYRIYEHEISKKYKNWVVCSGIDARYLKSNLEKDVKINIIPNVVDTNYYISKKSPSENTILFSGLMDKHVNQSAINFFLNFIFPKIVREIPSVTLYVVGPNPCKSLKNKANKNIIVTGKVSDIRKYIEKASIVVAPVTIGSGTRNKILQSWSHKRAIVSTSVGASGLKYINKKNIIIADTPNLFAEKVVSILQDNKLSNQLGENGRQWVKRYYSVNTMRKKYNQLINQLVNDDLKEKQTNHTSSNN